jgi:hypothetical protein
MQALVRTCTENYIKKINAARLVAGDRNSDLSREGGEQGRLNRIVAELDFKDPA